MLQSETICKKNKSLDVNASSDLFDYNIYIKCCKKNKSLDVNASSDLFENYVFYDY